MIESVMTQGAITNFYEHKPKGPPQQIVLLLHGLGADGRDLIGLAPIFAKALPDAIFISPDAPFHCDMAPMGHQWFSLREWTPETILKGVRDAAPILDGFITQQLERHGVPASKLALLGFSQGTMMSLYTGPRYKEPIAGILGYSGALVQDPVAVIRNKPPVCLIHGEADTIVPVSAWRHARTVLKDEGFTVSGHTTPGLLHGIDDEGIRAGAEFLKTVLGT